MRLTGELVGKCQQLCRARGRVMNQIGFYYHFLYAGAENRSLETQFPDSTSHLTPIMKGLCRSWSALPWSLFARSFFLILGLTCLLGPVAQIPGGPL
jgi:hypothetical protein